MTDQSLNISGVQVNYYFVCKRKLWLFSHNITMEHTSEHVEIGNIIHETSYARQKKEINFDGIKIDFYDKKSGIINEIKKSKAIDEAHKWQIRYYIYYFKNLGIDVKGQVDYPLLKRREQIELTEQDAEELAKVLEEIKQIKLSYKPPIIINKPFCKQCSYYDLCYI